MIDLRSWSIEEENSCESVVVLFHVSALSKLSIQLFGDFTMKRTLKTVAAIFAALAAGLLTIPATAAQSTTSPTAIEARDHQLAIKQAPYASPQNAALANSQSLIAKDAAAGQKDLNPISIIVVGKAAGQGRLQAQTSKPAVLAYNTQGFAIMTAKQDLAMGMPDKEARDQVAITKLGTLKAGEIASTGVTFADAAPVAINGTVPS